MTELPSPPPSETIQATPKQPRETKSPFAKLIADAKKAAQNPNQILKQLAEKFNSNPHTHTELNTFENKASQGFFDKAAHPIPNPGYKTQVNVFGAEFIGDADGKMVYHMHPSLATETGVVSVIDQLGDRQVRKGDEHTARDPGRVTKRDAKTLLSVASNPLRVVMGKYGPELTMLNAAKRYKRSEKEILEQVEKLGLTEYYGPHKDGIEIKKPEIFKQGRALHDIFRSDRINAPELNGIDRFDAVAKAASYIRQLHKRGSIGEAHTADILFRKREGDVVSDPVFSIPDVLYTQAEAGGEIGQKATDLLDFMACCGSEEYKRSERDGENPHANMKKVLDLVVESYAGKKDDSQPVDIEASEVVTFVESFARRGRLSLIGDEEVLEREGVLPKTEAGLKLREKAAVHSMVRLGIKKEYAGALRQGIIDACQEFKKPQEQA